MAKTMLFGPIGRQVEIPCPESGMSMVGVLDSEETPLLSGGLSVYRAPTTYKTYNMSWKGGTKGLSKNLQPIIDMHAGVYGRGPYYMTDPLAKGENLLPTRWASSWQLAHVAGAWGRPTTSVQTVTPEGEQSVFDCLAGTPLEGPAIAVPAIPGQPLFLKVWGTATNKGGVRIQRFNRATGLWESFATYTPKMNEHTFTEIISASEAAGGKYSAVRLAVWKGTLAADTSIIKLAHMELSTNTSGVFRMGKGSGALQFTGNASGTIDSAVIDRIGLSIDLKEVQRDPRN